MGKSRIDPNRTCGCGAAVSTRNVTGRCKACSMSYNRPMLEAKRIAAYRERMKDPVFAARNAAQRAMSMTPELIARRVAAAAFAKTGWCPEDRRDEYAKLRKRMGSVEARRIVQADMAAQERRRVDALSPFERQMERARRLGIVNKPDTRPVFETISYGVSSGML